jgi:hypothetical protein
MKSDFANFVWKAFRVFVELFAATFGSDLAAAFVVESLYPFIHQADMNLSLHQFRQILYLPYFPAQIGVAFTVGYLFRERIGTRFSLWMWVVPLLVFSWHFLTFHPSILQGFWRPRIDHFLGWGCRPEYRCFDQLGNTGPLYTSIAYTLGSFLKKETKRKIVID